MQLTAYHAKYIAHQLTRRCPPDRVEKLAAALADARVDLNPKELDRLIKDARRAATTGLTLEDKLAGQKQIRALEAQHNDKRRSLFDAQDRVDSQRDELIAAIEGKLTQSARTERLFAIRWVLE